MTKPRSIKLSEGKVKLYGFSKEIANQLEVYITKFKKVETVIFTEKKIKESELTIKYYDNKALGLVEKSPGQFKIVIVGYDCNQNEAGIEEIKDAGDFKQHALSMFQQEIFKRGLI